MCGNCERHVKQALEALPGVESAEADFPDRPGKNPGRGVGGGVEGRRQKRGL